MDIFNEQSAILVRKLSTELNKDSFNIFPYVTLCTLDIVCGEFRTGLIENAALLVFRSLISFGPPHNIACCFSLVSILASSISD